MTDTGGNGWWSRLEERTRREVDACVLRDQRMPAVRAAWEALGPLGARLSEAEQVVHARYAALGDRVRYREPDPLDVPSLAIRAGDLPGRVVAVEAVWDGDTLHNWFVELVAVLEAPVGEGRLATVRSERGQPAPSERASAAGRALADRLGVPFHFPSPDVPDDRAPRWRSVSRASERP